MPIVKLRKWFPDLGERDSTSGCRKDKPRWAVVLHPQFSAICLPILLLWIGSLSCAAVGQLNLLSTQDEVEIGRQAAREVEQSMPMYKNPVVVAYIDSLGQALVKHSRRSNIRYSFKVVDTDQVNAFALPGGWLYVNRGLILASEDESELAGVIGHEIGHVVGRHGARQISKQYGLAVLVGLVAGSSEGGSSIARDIAGQFASLGAGLTLLKYGRDAEREADSFAVEELHAAGIDPDGMATFFEKLLAMHEKNQGETATLFSTHPPTAERISNVRAQIQQLADKRGLKSDSGRFQQIKVMLKPAATDSTKQRTRRRRGQ